MRSGGMRRTASAPYTADRLLLPADHAHAADLDRHPEPPRPLELPGGDPLGVRDRPAQRPDRPVPVHPLVRAEHQVQSLPGHRVRLHGPAAARPPPAGSRPAAVDRPPPEGEAERPGDPSGMAHSRSRQRRSGRTSGLPGMACCAGPVRPSRGLPGASAPFVASPSVVSTRKRQLAAAARAATCVVGRVRHAHPAGVEDRWSGRRCCSTRRRRGRRRAGRRQARGTGAAIRLSATIPPLTRPSARPSASRTRPGTSPPSASSQAVLTNAWL